MKIKQYSNNLRLIVNTKKDTESVSFKIFVGVGSKDDFNNSFGIAHFTEHMFFKSTKNQNYKRILEKLDNLGVSHNAYTSITKTCYYFKCLTSALEPTLELFSEMFFNRTFKKQEIENEKRVILEEYKMDEDDQTKVAIENAFSSIFNESSYGHSIIGNLTSIKSITAEKIKKFKEKYTPNKVVISVSGNVSFKRVNKLIKKYFIPNFDDKNIEINYDEYKDITIKQKYIAKRKENKQSIVYILYDLGKMNLKERTMYKLYFSILGNGLSSKFMSIIRNVLGLVYDIDSDSSMMGQNCMGEIMFATSNDNVKSAILAVKDILNSCANEAITKEELQRAKIKYLTDIAFSNESNSSVASTNGSSLLSKGYIRTDAEIEKELKSITIDEINDIAKELVKNENFVVSGVGLCNQSDLKYYKF